MTTDHTALEMYQDTDDQWEALVTVVATGLPKDISLAAIQFSVKKKKSQALADILRQNTAAKGEASTEIVFTTDGTDGKFQITLVPANTSNLSAVRYFYSVELLLAGETRITHDGILTIHPHAIGPAV